MKKECPSKALLFWARTDNNPAPRLERLLAHSFSILFCPFLPFSDSLSSAFVCLSDIHVVV